ncbi:MAG: response regulator transcription factor [Acidobacteriota bacterium]
MHSATVTAQRHAFIIERDRAVRDRVRSQLTREGFAVAEADDGATAIERIGRERFDLIVLDRTNGDVDGVTLCRAIRARGQNTATPIVMLMADGGASDRALVLESGADDCLARAFNARELRARIRAILRRAFPVPDDPASTRPLHSHGVVMDPERRVVVVRGAPADLTGQEFDLLYTLASRPGMVFSRSALVARLWRLDREVTLRSIDTMISRLRRKIERDPSAPELVLTAWGAGYKFADRAHP